MINAADIKAIAIYPPLGVARVGNAKAPEDYFFASEVVGQPPRPPSGMRDSSGAILRQGVRFRVYAHLSTGGVRELTLADGVSIEWRVEVANLKAGWYRFNQAMDLSLGLAKDAERRNAAELDRALLDIIPTPKTVSGKSQNGPHLAFDDGRFYDASIPLGELRTDEVGRLIFLGGSGSSAPRMAGTDPTTFANNDGWHDDVCDGPVRAAVTVGGTRFEATPGYVVVAPPNFAPGLFGLVTMDDVAREVFFDRGDLARPITTTFARDVWPIFARLSSLQWINHGLFVTHGTGSPLDGYSTAVVERLRDPSPANAAWRARVRDLFRDPGEQQDIALTPLRVPEIYGDAYGENDGLGLARLAVTSTMYEHLQRWARGEFSNDWVGFPSEIRFDDLSPEDQVEQLERVGLHECLGGPFHPGIELSWPMRAKSTWAGAYRLAVLPEGQRVCQDYGQVLTPEECLNASGPLAGVGPGSLTRWLGVPWQTDEASCNSAADYEPTTFLSMPSYWGARVPDQVLSAESWERAAAETNGAVQRIKHFAYRSDWLRDVRGRRYAERIKNMVTEWWTLGIVTEIATPAALQSLGLPPVAYVEQGRHPGNAGSDPKVEFVAAVEGLANPGVGEAAGAVLPEEYVPARRRFHRGEI
jgi:hypothetical protein